jgi:hypothetical protein
MREWQLALQRNAAAIAATTAPPPAQPAVRYREWIFGYGPKFGLVAVDRETQRRTPKPSARHLGEIARSAST